MNTPIKAVAYYRMSTDKQEDSASTTQGRIAVVEYAAANGYEIIRWYIDEGISGSKSRAARIPTTDRGCGTV